MATPEGSEYTPNFGIVNITDSTATVTNSQHAGRTVTLNRAGGITLTLPAATGSGAKFRFVVGTTFTTSGVIQVANATDTMQGHAVLHQDSADTVATFDAGSTADTITLNGTTTGGLLGAVVEVEDIASGKFQVFVSSSATGTEATPFSAAVS